MQICVSPFAKSFSAFRKLRASGGLNATFPKGSNSLCLVKQSRSVALSIGRNPPLRRSPNSPIVPRVHWHQRSKNEPGFLEAVDRECIATTLDLSNIRNYRGCQLPRVTPFPKGLAHWVRTTRPKKFPLLREGVNGCQPSRTHAMHFG